MAKRTKSEINPMAGLLLFVVVVLGVLVKYWQITGSILVVSGIVYWLIKKGTTPSKGRTATWNEAAEPIHENDYRSKRSEVVFELESPRLIQIIRESTDIITNTKNPKTAVGRHNDIARCATRLFEIIPQGRCLDMEFNQRRISSIEDLYIIEEEKRKWLSDHGFPFDDEAILKYSAVRRPVKRLK